MFCYQCVSNNSPIIFSNPITFPMPVPGCLALTCSSSSANVLMLPKTEPGGFAAGHSEIRTVVVMAVTSTWQPQAWKKNIAIKANDDILHKRFAATVSSNAMAPKKMTDQIAHAVWNNYIIRLCNCNPTVGSRVLDSIRFLGREERTHQSQVHGLKPNSRAVNVFPPSCSNRMFLRCWCFTNK